MAPPRAGRLSGLVASARVALPRLVATFRTRLAAGASWNLLAALSLQGSVLLTSVIVARILGLSAFGAYAVLVAAVMTIATVAQGGSGLVASKFVGERLASSAQRVANVLRLCAWFTLATGLVASLLMMAAAGPLCSGILQRPELEPAVRLVALATFFQVSVSYQFGALQGFGAFRQLSRASAIAGIGHVVFNAAGAWLGGLNGALIGFVAASALRFVTFSVLLHVVRREHGIPPCHRLEADEWRKVGQFALPAGLAGLVTMPCLWLVTVLVAQLPEGLAIAALLSAAHQVRLGVLQLPSVLNAVSFSLLSRLKGRDEPTGYREVFWTGLWMNLLFATAVVVVLAVLAEPVLRIYGEGFVAGRWVLVILLLSVLPELLAITTYQLVQSAGRMWQSLFFIAAPRDLTYLALAAAVVSPHGAIGAAVAYLVAQGVGLAATVLIARRHAGTVWSGNAP